RPLKTLKRRLTQKQRANRIKHIERRKQSH
ncbi:hypothetical protein LCGC14_3055100, partial [marine sediment metagenome]